ncbi:MAG: glycosyltransferase family 4 protein [Methanosarcina sp.]|uniref:glycosyltransferase family 4 protein n=1 Tax=Methanosarcina sp. TaxID=2213 RepID=UPI00261B6AA5|nr:glycosyltransferase family 4 protein [Methanosarcina sp.]MDD3247362.1 glycosyltransferase family 4 protein [Methanosarcina sp.]MDD4249942.1 glycosyltransferase family 4 protein [Methanosarcina sp.]
MKIAFVYDAVYPWVKGGAEMRIHELGKRLSSQGHDVHLFGIKWWEGGDVIEYEGMTLHGVCKARELYAAGRRSISEALVFSVKLFPYLRREKFDLIDVSVFPYFSCITVKLVSVLKRSPAIFTWHEVWDDYWYEYMGKAGFFGKVIEKAVSKIADNNIAVSDWTKKRLEALGVPEEKIVVILNGIDLKKISEIESEGGLASVGLEGKIYDIIFVGRLIKEKNVDVLFKAVALLKADFQDLRCCIVGDGPEKEALVGLAKKLGVSENVKFEGFQEYGALIGKIKASKTLVLPSSREGFGMVVIEAFACLVPVVTVRKKYNAAQGLVEDGVDGFVVELEEREIAKAVGKIIVKNSGNRNISEAAFNKAKKYDWDEIFENISLVYDGCVKKSLK